MATQFAKRRKNVKRTEDSQHGSVAETIAGAGPKLLRVKTDRNGITMYRALVKAVNDITKHDSGYVAYGWTAGGRGAVEEVVRRMAETRADLPDKVKTAVNTVAEYMAKAVSSGATGAAVAMRTYFYPGEYITAAVRVERVPTYPPPTGMWRVLVRAAFRGYDGHAASSRHVVERYMEFYSDKVDMKEVYNALYEAAQIAINARSR